MQIGEKVNKAIILGNGANREGMFYGDTLDIWACNLAFRENLNIKTLVATDAHRQHEIYCSGYANDNRCIFLDWNPVTSDGTTPELLELAGFTTKYNDYDSHGAVISGWNNTMFFTYLNETDKVENVKMSELPKRFSSGGFAMWLAAKEGYKEILLAGFGDTKHAYREYAEGVDIPHVKIWEEERKFIIDSFKDVKWRYV